MNKHNGAKWLPRKKRLALYARDGFACAYCGTSDKLSLDHLVPRIRKRGHNGQSNLITACVTCNQRKGNQTAEEFGYPQIQAQAEKPLKAVAAVNATRWELYRRIQNTGLPVEVGSGGRTKFNRIQHRLPKTHWMDILSIIS